MGTQTRVPSGQPHIVTTVPFFSDAHKTRIANSQFIDHSHSITTNINLGERPGELPEHLSNPDAGRVHNCLSFSLPSTTDAWSLMDWSRFVSAWKREERIERDSKLQAAVASVSSSTSPRSPQHPLSQDQPNVDTDHVLKASTDRLSTVFDWLIDQIPASAKSISTSPSSSDSTNAPVKAPERVVEAAHEMMDELNQKAQLRSREQEEMKTSGNGKTNELESKEDLERFYVALARKMYDDGL
ncbi:hypothetical protein NP233_g858 [Leucocoprinus birnbaumii]|uniref:Uncharacterized protein n=1 Tax=Leucocoprinus birnbaumii TaxID=56174 RepID=A0AAD5YYE7_9AGAR|nr:hypothetical protein NP233_g858 [Leucocoprinus birnbaumii]